MAPPQPPPQQLRLPLLGSEPQTPSVTTFRFDLGGRALEYQPGQFGSMKLEGIADPRGSMRSFTLSSSPTESGWVAITTRISGRSPFKERLSNLRPGEEVDLRAPMGEFTLDTRRPAVMLAGGIGVTPFRSMIRYAADRALELPIVLLYSSRTPEEIVFMDELDELARQHRTLKVVYTITRPGEARETWAGRIGRFDAGSVRAKAAGLSQATYYVCGSEAMVDGATRMLTEELHVPKNDIRSEEFPGY
jgi:ferredoxin-NADP reductase